MFVYGPEHVIWAVLVGLFLLLWLAIGVLELIDRTLKSISAFWARLRGKSG